LYDGKWPEPAADHQADLALERPARPDEARDTLDALHVLRVRRGEAFEHVGLELGGVVEEMRHTEAPGNETVRLRGIALD
jgi:hypothetical protein